MRQHGTGGQLVLLGDQLPAHGLGFSSTTELAHALGFSKCVSIDYNGRADLNLDLNYPVPETLHNCADMLYDGGVLEHVANIGAAWQSIVAMTKVGGIVIHCNPLCCYGDSYYGLDPSVFRDVYESNGFKTLYCSIYHRVGWRMRLHWMVLRCLPPALVERLRARLQRTTTTKQFLLADNPRDLKYVKPTGRQWRNVPLTAHTIWVGRKLEIRDTWSWCAQANYPKQP